MPDISRGLGRIGGQRFRARVGTAFDGIYSVNMAGRIERLTSALRRLDRQGRIPLDAATLGSLACRINDLRRELAAAELAVELRQEAEEAVRQIDAKNLALIAENRELSRQLAEASGLELAEWATGDEIQDSGVPEVAVGHLRNPLAVVEARLQALTEGEQQAPAGVDPDA